MELSYWELKNWFTNVDFTIVGSGIVGLNAALRLRSRFPSAKILILEKGMLPHGASTKNAGFACFGSLSEIVDDLLQHSEQEVLNLIQKRWDGLSIMRKMLGDQAIGFRQHGGYELFADDDQQNQEQCFAELSQINKMLKPVFSQDVFSITDDAFQFGNVSPKLVFSPLEAQIDTGQMMAQLLKLAISNDILILNRQKVTGFNDLGADVEVHLDDFMFRTNKLLFATNGFAGELTGGEVKPARAQVLITNPIPDLHIKGTFHFDKGYYYFRNIDNRILFGGGRNLDFQGETTIDFGQSDLIQNQLQKILKEVILPGREFSIDHRWSGIMGMGDKKNPIVRPLSDNVFCGVRLGGMGVAIGSVVGQELADLI